MFFHKSLKAQVIGTVGIAILLYCIVFSVSTSNLSGSIEKMDINRQGLQAMQSNALRANIEFKRQVQEWKNVLLRGHIPEKNEKYWKNFNTQHDKVQKLVKDLEANFMALGLTDQQDIAKKFLNSHQNMRIAYTNGREAYEQAGFKSEVGDKFVSGIDRSPSVALDEIANYLEENNAIEYKTIIRSADKAILWSYISAIFAALVSLLFTLFFINQRILSPLHYLSNAFIELGQGELGKPIRLDRTDQLGDVANHADSLRKSLQSLISKLKTVSEQLDNSATKINSQANKVQQATCRQQQHTKQIEKETSELAINANEVSQNAISTSEDTTNTKENARESVDSMNTANKTMNTLADDIVNAATAIQKLADEANNVGAVLNVIKGIAEQTNLLALNAAIEAARAGEQGRGFAVVADEVRSLAQKTQHSTEEIQKILEGVQSSATNAVDVMAKGQRQTKIGVDQVLSVGEKINYIAIAIENIANKNSQMSDAALQQTTVSEVISKDVHEVSKIISSLSDIVNESLLESEKLKSLSSDINLQLGFFR